MIDVHAIFCGEPLRTTITLRRRSDFITLFSFQTTTFDNNVTNVREPSSKIFFSYKHFRLLVALSTSFKTFPLPTKRRFFRNETKRNYTIVARDPRQQSRPDSLDDKSPTRQRSRSDSKFRSGRGHSVPYSRLPYWTPAFVSPVEIVKPIRNARSQPRIPILTRIVPRIRRRAAAIVYPRRRKIRESTTHLITCSDSRNEQHPTRTPFHSTISRIGDEPIDGRSRSTNRNEQ